MEKNITMVKGFLDFEHRKDMTQTDIADIFSQMAESYDEAYAQLQYKMPICTAEKVAALVPPEDRIHYSILDVAAGTGLLGQELQKLGFTCIDWLDPAEGMKPVASKKNIYRQFFVEFMDGHEIQSIPTDCYDCVVLCGGLNEGLISCAAFTEMIRITKPGGYICFIIVDRFVDEVPEYANRLVPLFAQLQTEGKWKMVSHVRHSSILDTETECTVRCYQVL